MTGSPAVASPGALPGPSAPTEGWHAVAPSDALDRLGSSLEGLDAEEAARRLARFGPNSLAPPKRVSALRILLEQFASVVVGLLVAASVLALFVGDLLEAAAIGVVLAINTVVGFVVEVRARRAMEGLLRFQVPVSRVVRGGQVSELPANRLVPGDVVEVESGDAVPADARIVSAAELRADEAALTGESAPLDKGTAPVEPAATLAERASMLYAGTTVTMGRARAVVVATGRATELGRIGTLLEKIRQGPTPLERRLDALGHRLIWLALGVTGAVVAAGSLRGAPLRTM
ncbi:MAG TPA: cation-transporting P-type ATPase, partial [Longimicrobiales bacterium]|nr:cation-transporting P-type ATPase [Longimicrobiales bacterium]